MVEQAAQGNEARDFQHTGRNVATKPMFREAFKSKRCMIPASGYYEWHDAPGGKQPYTISRGATASPSRSRAYVELEEQGNRGELAIVDDGDHRAEQVCGGSA
jgi:hypothetical protein